MLVAVDVPARLPFLHFVMPLYYFFVLLVRWIHSVGLVTRDEAGIVTHLFGSLGFAFR